MYTIEMKLVHDQEEITKEDAQFSVGKKHRSGKQGTIKIIGTKKSKYHFESISMKSKCII